MELNKVLEKRVRGMAVRILAALERALQANFDVIGHDKTFNLSGSELQIIRSEILNAAGDTTRSLLSLVEQPQAGRLSLTREMIAALNVAKVSWAILDDDAEEPVFRLKGDFNLLRKFRDEIGTGVVYNKTYTCIGLDSIIESLMPFLDLAQFAGIKIANGDYKQWRTDICDMYLEGLGDGEN